MRIEKVSVEIFLATIKTSKLHHKHVGLDFTVNKVVQVVQRVVVTTAIDIISGKDIRLCTTSIDCYVTKYKVKHELCF